MPASKDSIPTYGEEGLFITRYLVSQIVGGRSNNIADTEVDLDWVTFKNTNKDLFERWISKYPGKTDRFKKVRDFYNRHKKERFQKYIATGEGKCGCRRLLDHFELFLASLSQPCSLAPSTTGYRRDFLKTCPELVALGGRDIIAGDDEEEDEEDDAVFADTRQEQQEADPAPAQEPEPVDLEDLQDAIKDLAALDLNNEDGMKVITKRIDYLPVSGAPIDVPTAIHAVVAVLEPGTQLSTITSCLSKNQLDGEVRAMQAPELNLAQKLLPHKKMARQNPSIGDTLALAIQEVLNLDETDKSPFSPRPISKGNFTLPNRGAIGGIDGPLDPADLGLKPEARGDKFILHKVEVSHASGTVPCFVAIFFFLEERTQKTLHSPQFDRKLPGFDLLPPRADGSNKKRRGAGAFSTFANLFSWG
jgi:hypothetical protein